MTVADGNIEAIYPLTPAQEGILFHSLLAPDAPLYFQQYTCVIEGRLDIALFQKSWQHVIDRHDVLRSLLAWEGRDKPLQIVRRRVVPAWRVEDWRASANPGNRLDRYLEADRASGFELDVAPLMRFGLFRVGEEASQFVWSHHHIILDGWSLGIILGEVLATYEAWEADKQPDLGSPARYRDYVRWLKSRDRGEDEAFWRGRLGDFQAATPLAFDQSSSHRPWAERHAQESVRVDRQTAESIASFARSQGVTLNTLLTGAWAIVLSRYSGEQRVVFGNTVAGRPHDLAGSLDMVGLFINTLPVSVEVTLDAGVKDWLTRIQKDQIDASLHELTPLVDVQKWSGVGSGEPLFESLLVFENVPGAAGETSLLISDVQYLQRSNYPLAVLVMPGDELDFVLLFDAERFEGSIIRRLARQLVHVLEEFSHHAAGRVGDVGFFPDEELHQLLHTWNQTSTDYPADRTIHALFEEASISHPHAVAVAGSGVQLTYAELDDRANALAGRLRQLGVVTDDRVAVALERSPAMVVGILGALKAGGAYVPLEPTLPDLRRRQLLEGVSARVIVGANDTWQTEGPPVVVVEPDGRLADAYANDGADSHGAEVSPDDLAYVIHTSGSTGTPKGVAVTHRSLVNSTNARLVEYRAPVGTFLLVSPFVFDSSVAGIFSTLTQAGTLVLPGSGMEQDVHHLGALIQRHSVSHTLLLPSLYALLLELTDPAALQTLELVMVAGEPCPPELIDRHRTLLPHARLVNEYGPSEATVWCTVHDVTATGQVSSGGRVPIGHPIANTQVYVLDELGRPAPVGVPGELHIGGLGLARGYLNDPQLTATSFVDCQFETVGPVRLYRTGDVARRLDDGSIDLVGRLDHQIKVRGQRVELAEIEMTLRQHPAVRDAVVVYRPPSGAGSSRLIAYAETGSAEESVAAGELVLFLADRLPPVMIPSSVMRLNALPRGSTGKIDRALLPDPMTEPNERMTRFLAPAGPIEEQLASIWAEVLGLETVGAGDNFFALGGDSILSIRVIARAHQRGLTISPKDFFDHPTIKGLAGVTRAVDQNDA